MQRHPKRTQESDTLTWFAARSIWKKQIGGRMFYLGPDQGAAEAEATAIKARWRRLKAEGHKGWPEGEPKRLQMQDALGIGAGAPGTALGTIVGAPAPLPSAEELISPTALSVENTANLFVAAQRSKGAASERTLADLRIRLGKAIDVLGRGKRLNDIRKAELEAFMGDMRRKIKAGDISTIYARHLVAAAKSMLACRKLTGRYRNKGEPIKSGDTLGEDYCNANEKIVDEQITKAGLRLAAVLNKLYDPGAPMPDFKPAAAPAPNTEPSAPSAPKANKPTAEHAKFVGSKNSEVYHYPTCSTVKTIKPENLVEYADAPEGKRLHAGCPK